MTGESRGFSRVAVGGLGFLSRYHREVREPLVLPQGSQVSIRLVRVSASALESRQGNQASIPLEGGISRCFSSCSRKFDSLELPRGPEGASHVVSGKSGILSSCEGLLGIPLELVQATRASSRVEGRISLGFSS